MKLFVFAVLVAAVAANQQYPSKPSYPAPAAYPSKSYDYPPMPYSFNWAVKDEPSYNDYAHQETGDEKGYVTGSYRVLLPDGRTQTVTYQDNGNGYVAEVKYDGEPKYPEYKPAASYKAPASYPAPPAYPKAPAYPAKY